MTENKGMDALPIGAVERMSKTISEADVYAFAGITGDFYGVHVDEEFAKKTRYGTRIAHAPSWSASSPRSWEKSPRKFRRPEACLIDTT